MHPLKQTTLFMSLILTLTLIYNTASAQVLDDFDKTKDKKISFLEELDLTKNHFESETRAGLIVTTGNTDSISASGHHKTIYRIKRFENTWHLGAYFNRVSSTTNGNTSGTIAQYIFGTYRLDYYFKPRTTVFIGGGGYSDELKGINLGSNFFTGVSHYLILNETHSLRIEGGYDFTFENRVNPTPNDSIHSIASTLNYNWNINERVEFRQIIAAKQNVEKASDFRLNTDSELKVGLSKALSAVIGFHVRLDNDPVAGFNKVDTITDFSFALNF